MTVKELRTLINKLPDTAHATVMIKLDMLDDLRERYAHVAAVSLAYDEPEHFELADFDALVLECNVYPGDIVKPKNEING